MAHIVSSVLAQNVGEVIQVGADKCIDVYASESEEYTRVGDLRGWYTK